VVMYAKELRVTLCLDVLERQINLLLVVER
jgi:hypothetical protein